MFEKMRVYRFVEEDGFKGTRKEIVLQGNSHDAVSFSELLGGFRQYLVMLGYGEDTAKMLIPLNQSDLEILGIELKDLALYDWDKILER